MKSESIGKFVLQDMWFDVNHDLPHQLEHGFDRISLLDKEGLSLCLSRTRRSTYGDDDDLRARARVDLRLLYVRICRHEMHARRGKWISIELGAINSAIVDLLVVLNDRLSCHRYSSGVTRLLHCPRGRESDWHTRLVLA